MPGLVNGRKRHASHVSHDSDDEDDASQSSQALGSATKRARTNANLESSPLRPLLLSSYRVDSLTDRSDAHPPAFQPGSIVKVLMKDFVTYKEAEFLLGPSLNMVIGPNGTGKSSLVCAICLGLGWRTEHLGRAKDVGEFVRHGASKAVVEIELARDPDRHDSNPVIQLHIERNDNKTHFFLNGRAVTRKKVQEECRAFSIQVDNLCQFLPQDRVVEFAALNPIDLLAETLRAAAPEETSAQHETLKHLFAHQSKIIIDQKMHSDSLKGLELRHNAQRTDVERLKERAACQERIGAFKLFLPQLRYSAAKAAWEESKTRKLAARQELTRLQEEVGPALESAKQKSRYVQDIKAVLDKRNKMVVRADNHATAQFKVQNEFAEKIAASEKDIETERKRAKDLTQARTRTRNAIEELKIKMQSRPPSFDAASFNERIRDYTRQVRDIEEKCRDAEEKTYGCTSQIRQREVRIKRLSDDIVALRSQAGRQEGKLRQRAPETFRAWQWVKANQASFRETIHGPAMLTCTVKDQRYADAVESVFGQGDLMAFTATNDEDFLKLQEGLVGKDGLRLMDVQIRTSKSALSRYQPSVARERLSELGLDAYVLDLLEGPEAVLAMLCDGRAIHQTAVALRRLNQDQVDMIRRTDINTFVTPTEIYTTTRRREYGDAATSTRTRRTKKAEIFTDSAVDLGAERELKNSIQDAQSEIEELNIQREQHKRVIDATAEQLKDTNKAKEDVENEKAQLQTALATFNALPTKLETERARLKANEDNLANLEAKLAGIRNRMNADIIEKGKNSTMFAISIFTLQKYHIGRLEAELARIEAESDLETINARNNEINALLEARASELEAVRTELAKRRDEAAKLVATVNNARAETTEEQVVLQQEIPEDQTVEGLQNEIAGLQARLEMVHEGNSNVLKEYEERAVRIDKCKEKLERLGNELGQLDGQISAIKQEWEPTVDALIRQISAAFEDNLTRIGCSGGVEVLKTEDFADWSILIKVKFRENEQLSVLDSHRQSGGERAVSTIFYLMALQSLARAPFRVVDEINQGMDPRNERLVHARMVDIACAEHTSQYFLITPKLLPNLKYDPRMKIHCIASGELMPKDHKQLDFQSLATKALGVQQRLASVRV